MVLPVKMRLLCTLALAVLLSAAPGSAVSGQLTPQNVLLVVNTNSADSTAIGDAYLAKYGLDVHVWEYAGSTAVTITRATFDAELRGPLDDYLSYDPPGDEQPLYKIIRVLVTTKGVPRRIDDFDSPGIGEYPFNLSAEYDAGNYDAASVDSDLALLHQRLTVGSSPLPDHIANNHVRNPYHAGTERIDTFPRDNATIAKTFSWDSIRNGWRSPAGTPSLRLTAGDIYLVTRLTGYTADEAIAALDRSGTITVNRNETTVVVDRDGVNVHDNAAPYSQGEDFPETRDMLQVAGFSVDYDETSLFITTSALEVIGYAAYGRNHVPVPLKTYILDTLDFDLAPGAIFNTYESFNGRNCETADPPHAHDFQGQVADWIRIGGTLGLAHVWEPCAFSVGDNEILYQRMLCEGWTFAEAAYASLPVLSWQNIVVGDPLATFEIVDAGTPVVEVSTEDDLDWVYQNIPQSMVNGGHRVTLTVTIIDLNGNNTVTVTVQKKAGSGPGEVDIQPGATELEWAVFGSDRAGGTDGPLVLEVICQGDLSTSAAVVELPLQCRLMGDVDDNGGPEPTDIALLINRLNGIPTPPHIHANAFDLDANGGAEPADVSILIAILNGLL